MAACTCAVDDWLLHNRLALNPDKSEAAVYEMASCVQSLKGDTIITVAGVHDKLSYSIKSLGVTIDENFTFDKHVRNVCKASYYHTHQSSPVNGYLLHSSFGSRLAYCNALWLEYLRPTSTNCRVSRIFWPELSRKLVFATTSRQFSQIYTGYQSVQG